MSSVSPFYNKTQNLYYVVSDLFDTFYLWGGVFSKSICSKQDTIKEFFMILQSYCLFSDLFAKKILK